jgi:SAM-dependent methyltransferase
MKSNNNNTAKSFSEKWHKNENLAFSKTLDESSDIFNWITTRNGLQNAAEWRTLLSNKKRILDAGCGNGRVTALLRDYSIPEQTEVVGIDLTASDVAQKNLSNRKNVTLLAADLMKELSSIGKFDYIYCQEVLHHTPDPQLGFQNLVEILENGGEIAIYVYKLKAPMREYCDDFVRAKIETLPYEEALKACAQITQFGKSLSALNTKITISDVEVLGIEAGEYDVQRLIYHFFMKCFWSADFDDHDNDVINYDWYHPHTATRHSLREVRGWFQESNLTITHEHVDAYGITMRGKKI